MLAQSQRHSPERVTRAFPIPKVELAVNVLENLVVGRSFEIGISFDKGSREVPLSYIKANGDPVTVKVGVAVDFDSTKAIHENELYQEIPFTEEGTRDRIVFRVKPLCSGRLKLKIHHFDNNRYHGSTPLDLQVKASA